MSAHLIFARIEGRDRGRKLRQAVSRDRRVVQGSRRPRWSRTPVILTTHDRAWAEENGEGQRLGLGVREYALTPRGRDLVARLLPLAWWIAVHADEIVYGTADSARPADWGRPAGFEPATNCLRVSDVKSS